MDAKFHPAIAAIMAGDLASLRGLLVADPGLATARSSRSHPTLLQCLVLEAGAVPNQVELAQALIEAGAEVDGPLVAAASANNVPAVAALLDAGAAIDGRGGWSPLEEALYWVHPGVVELLLARGASIRNLRCAAGLGRTDLIDAYFDADEALKPEAGDLDWPFGDALTSNHPCRLRDEARVNVDGRSRTAQAVIDNALVYACMHHRLEAAKRLLQRGAQVNVLPPGFDYGGSGLHYAALHGHRDMVDLLLAHGADPGIRDAKVNQTAAGWALFGGHAALAEHLEAIAAATPD